MFAEAGRVLADRGWRPAPGRRRPCDAKGTLGRMVDGLQQAYDLSNSAARNKIPLASQTGRAFMVGNISLATAICVPKKRLDVVKSAA